MAETSEPITDRFATGGVVRWSFVKDLASLDTPRVNEVANGEPITFYREPLESGCFLWPPKPRSYRVVAWPDGFQTVQEIEPIPPVPPKS